jgi:hypothetical protein
MPRSALTTSTWRNDRAAPANSTDGPITRAGNGVSHPQLLCAQTRSRIEQSRSCCPSPTHDPGAIAVDTTGTVCLFETVNSRVRKMTALWALLFAGQNEPGRGLAAVSVSRVTASRAPSPIMSVLSLTRCASATHGSGSSAATTLPVTGYRPADSRPIPIFPRTQFRCSVCTFIEFAVPFPLRSDRRRTDVHDRPRQLAPLNRQIAMPTPLTWC